MQATEPYLSLRKKLDKHPCGCPEAPEIYLILQALFTREEAKVAKVMAFVPKPLSWIAQKAGLSPEETERLLSSMADKGIIYARFKEGQWGYSLLPVMPGLFEFPYMNVQNKELTKKLTPLWKKYFPLLSKGFGSPSMQFSRIVPIQEKVESEPGVLTYEMVYELIDNSKSVGIATCACRAANQECDAPLEACMLFDDTCDFLVSRGYGRYLTKEEMKEKLRKFDELGLVHQVNNAKDKLIFICNCCPCCCGLLNAQIKFGNPHVVASSGFIPEVDTDSCTGCGICVDERCPFKAIYLKDDIAHVDGEKCLGCGLCVTGCPSQSLRLVRRDKVPVPAETTREMGLKVLEEKGKLEDFIKINID